MKLVITLIISLHYSVFAKGPSSNNIKTLKFGYFSFPPHITIVDGKPTGPAKSYIDRVFNSLNIDLNWVQTPHARTQISLNTGSIDVSLPAVPTKERLKLYKFGSQPMVRLTHGFITHKDANIKLKDILEGDYLVHSPKATTLHRSLNPEVIKIKEVSGFNTRERLIEMVLKKRIKVVTFPGVNLILKTLETNPIYKNIKVTELNEDTEIFLTFKKSTDIAFIKKVDKKLRELQKRTPYSLDYQVTNTQLK